MKMNLSSIQEKEEEEEEEEEDSFPLSDLSFPINHLKGNFFAVIQFRVIFG